MTDNRTVRVRAWLMERASIEPVQTADVREHFGKGTMTTQFVSSIIGELVRKELLQCIDGEGGHGARAYVATELGKDHVEQAQSSRHKPYDAKALCLAFGLIRR